MVLNLIRDLFLKKINAITMATVLIFTLFCTLPSRIVVRDDSK